MKRVTEYSSIKRIVLSIVLLTSFTMLVVSCAINPKDEYSVKEEVGIFGENQGMLCFEGHLYSDSTFFIPNSGLGWAEGIYKINKATIYFEITNGEKAYFKPIELKLDSARKKLMDTNTDKEINYVHL